MASFALGLGLGFIQASSNYDSLIRDSHQQSIVEEVSREVVKATETGTRAKEQGGTETGTQKRRIRSSTRRNKTRRKNTARKAEQGDQKVEQERQGTGVGDGERS